MSFSSSPSSAIRNSYHSGLESLRHVHVGLLEYARQPLHGPVPDSWQCEERSTDRTGEQPGSASLAHDVASVALVHLPPHPVPAHGALQGLLHAGQDGGAPAAGWGAGEAVQARLDKILDTLLCAGVG